ncbi:hypothetical protein HYT58_01450 [Candidatus Woesearchaeota archaeon]|nr:hypothetical protein [Candidatus Woesearchaeota archaeon]
MKRLQSPLTKEEVTYVHRRTLGWYREHPIMQPVLSKRVTLEDTTKELMKVNSGLRFILPHKRDVKHNQKVSQLGELLPSTVHLKTMGRFAPDNLITGGLVGFLLVYGISKLIYGDAQPGPAIAPEDFEVMKDFLQVKIPYTLGAFSGLVAGTMANVLLRGTPGVDRSPEFNLIYQARYIDQKVQELM